MSNDDDKKKTFPKVPDEAIIKGEEEEKPVETTLRPEEVESKDEAEYEQMKTQQIMIWIQMTIQI